MTVKKLVRDRIPEILEREKGVKPETRIMDRQEYLHELRWKLLEEVREACVAHETSEFLRELADLTEVIRANVTAHGFTMVELEREREKKLAEKGGFDNRIFLISDGA